MSDGRRREGVGEEEGEPQTEGRDDEEEQEQEEEVGFYDMDQPEIQDGDFVRDEDISDAEDLLSDEMMAQSVNQWGKNTRTHERWKG